MKSGYLYFQGTQIFVRRGRRLSSVWVRGENEAGANEQWIPGGRLPDGASEAVVDGVKIPRDDYTVTDISK
jgi:hypothetical protein